MSDIIERAEKALEGVTPGDWDVRDGFVYPLSIRCTLGGIRVQDAEFIAAARTLVPWLVAELKAARAEAQQWRDVADRIGAETPDELYEGMTTFLYSIEIEGGYGTWGCSTLSEVFTAFGVKPGDTLKEVFELSERLRGESA